MKIIILLFSCMTISIFGYSQKTLNTEKIYSIPIGNELGLVREYTNDEILTFIELSGWKSFYKENIKLVPFAVARLSREAIGQFFIEAKNVWYSALQNNTIEGLRKGIIEKYGHIDSENFRKYGILLLALEKIDRAIKYSQ